MDDGAAALAWGYDYAAEMFLIVGFEGDLLGGLPAVFVGALEFGEPDGDGFGEAIGDGDVEVGGGGAAAGESEEE